MAETARWKALAGLTLGACVIGAAPILTRLTQTDPAAAGLWRIGFALPLLALLVRRGGETLGGPHRMAMIAGVMFALDLTCWHYGIRYTSVMNATALPNLTPVFVTLFAWIVLRQKPGGLFMAALAGALTGAALLAAGGDARPGLNPPLGDALSAFTAIWYAGYFLAIGAGRASQSTARLMFWSGAVSLPLILIACLVLGERILPAGPAGWAACLGLGIVHVVGQGSIAWAMGRLPTALASVVVLVQPVVAALLGWLIFAETILPVQALGAAVLLGAVVLAQLSARPKPTVVSA